MWWVNLFWWTVISLFVKFALYCATESFGISWFDYPLTVGHVLFYIVFFPATILSLVWRIFVKIMSIEL